MLKRKGLIPPRPATQNFTEAVIEFDAVMRSGRFQHDGNPVLEWCIGTVVGKPDRRGNLYPTKARSEQKIDAAVALVTAIGRAMLVEPEQVPTMFWAGRVAVKHGHPLAGAHGVRRCHALLSSPARRQPGPEWCIYNVVGKLDRRGNLYTTKAQPEQKIDAAVELIMAVGRSMTEPEQFTSIFERAELWVA